MKISIKLALLTAMFIGTGCSHANNTVSKGVSSMVDLSNAKNGCAGRYTIQLPKNAVQFGGGDIFNSFEINSVTGSSVDALNAEFDSQKEYFSHGVSTITVESPLKKMGSKSYRIFSGKPGTVEGAPLLLKFWVLDQSVLFTFEIPYMPEMKDVVFKEMDMIIANLSARNNNSVPTSKGICILNGFIKDSDSLFRKSSHSIAYTLSGMPSVKMSMKVDAVAQQAPDLIARTDAKLKRAGIFYLTLTSYKTIRKGQKNQTTGELDGVEYVSKAPMKGKDGIIANWEHGGTAHKTYDPAVLFNFDTGYTPSNVKTTDMTKTEALKTYELILKKKKKF